MEESVTSPAEKSRKRKIKAELLQNHPFPKHVRWGQRLDNYSSPKLQKLDPNILSTGNESDTGSAKDSNSFHGEAVDSVLLSGSKETAFAAFIHSVFKRDQTWLPKKTLKKNVHSGGRMIMGALQYLFNGYYEAEKAQGDLENAKEELARLKRDHELIMKEKDQQLEDALKQLSIATSEVDQIRAGYPPEARVISSAQRVSIVKEFLECPVYEYLADVRMGNELIDMHAMAIEQCRFKGYLTPDFDPTAVGPTLNERCELEEGAYIDYNELEVVRAHEFGCLLPSREDD